jgi:hypothetical protein
MMIFARIVLCLSGLMFAGFGGWLLLRPEALGEFVKLDAGDPATLTEVRAFYGGLEIGLGLFLLGAAAIRRAVVSGLVLVLLVFGATAMGRGAGLVFDGPDPSGMIPYLAVEVAAAVLAAIALISTRNRN